MAASPQNLRAAPARSPWPTIGWTGIILAVLVLLRYVTAICGMAMWQLWNSGNAGFNVRVQYNLTAVADLVCTASVSGMVWAILRWEGYSIRGHLALRWPGCRQIVASVIGLVALAAVIDGTTYALGYDLVAEDTKLACECTYRPLLLVEVIVVVPFGEELIWRGFLFGGISTSRWGWRAALLISSIGWAALHVQYNVYWIAWIFVVGLYLGLVRWKFASLPLVMVLHGMIGAIAMAEAIRG